MGRWHVLEAGEDEAYFEIPTTPPIDERPDGEVDLVTIGVWRSAGTDGAWVIQIDTNFEPDDLPLRINLNDQIIHGPLYYVFVSRDAIPEYSDE